MLRVLGHVMRVMVVVFYLPPNTPKPIRNKFPQKLYGQAVSSWGGKYRYRKVGFLETIPYGKLHSGVILVRDEDLGSLLDFLKEWDTIVEVREIIPLEEDIEVLSIDKD
jgi:hypothetical protein